MTRKSFVARTLFALRGWVVVLVLVVMAGCTTTQYITKRDTRENSLAATLDLLSRQGPKVQDRTSFSLRRYGLEKDYHKDIVKTLNTLREMASDEADTERQFAVAEIAYIAGKQAEAKSQPSTALEYYIVALTSSYQYLFSDAFSGSRSPYDPQFRGACDLYNEALEDSLRLLSKDNKLRPGTSYSVTTEGGSFTIDTAVRGSWSADEFDHFEFVSDYEIQTLNNRHRTFGLGVPLIAVRKRSTDENASDKYYPDGLSFPVTVLLRAVRDDTLAPAPTILQTANSEPNPGTEPRPSQRDGRFQYVLEFYDPLQQNQIYLANHWVPLQTDITTPLAYLLDNEQFRDRNSATKNLIYPGKRPDAKGLFMLEPYDPQRIPVVMVHGLWSSPMTWMDMFNDLRSFPEIRQRYQFWFYLYPTGQPFWISATQMRTDLAAVRETFDPGHRHPTMDQMVLVGHSMGGLVSRLQTLESGDDFWNIVSDKPIEQLQGDPDDVNKLVSTLKFKPNQAINRVVTIATPHRGSDFSNPYTQWIGRRLIRIPKFIIRTGNQLIRENPDTFKNTELLTMTTSIDSLAPESPIFPVMLRAESSPRVIYHNIVGIRPFKSLIGRDPGPSDGVVSYASASVPGVASEKKVDADHVSIHTRPETILEVRRILQLHLRTLDQSDRVASLPTMDTANQAPSMTLEPNVPQSTPIDFGSLEIGAIGSSETKQIPAYIGEGID